MNTPTHALVSVLFVAMLLLLVYRVWRPYRSPTLAQARERRRSWIFGALMGLIGSGK